MNIQTVHQLQKKAKQIRELVVSAIGTFGSGHIGGALSAADLLALLYFHEMKIDPTRPDMPGRDRFVLSKGHAGPVLYAALALRGYFDISDLKTLNQPGTRFPSHCDMLLTPGVDMTAGSLGQGCSCAVGMAKAAKITGGSETIFALIGDGESQEGAVWECAMAAAQYQLDNLIFFLDYNKLQLDGPLEKVMDIGEPVKTWAAFGFKTVMVDGHDILAMHNAIQDARSRKDGRPTMIVLDTIKGKGVSFIEAMGAANHSTTLSPEETVRAFLELRRQEEGT